MFCGPPARATLGSMCQSASDEDAAGVLVFLHAYVGVWCIGLQVRRCLHHINMMTWCLHVILATSSQAPDWEQWIPVPWVGSSNSAPCKAVAVRGCIHPGAHGPSSPSVPRSHRRLLRGAGREGPGDVAHCRWWCSTADRTAAPGASSTITCTCGLLLLSSSWQPIVLPGWCTDCERSSV